MPWSAWGQGAPGQRESPHSPAARRSSPGQGRHWPGFSFNARLCSPLCSSRDDARDAPRGVRHQEPAPPLPSPCPLRSCSGVGNGDAAGAGDSPRAGHTTSSESAGVPPASWFPDHSVPQLLPRHPADTASRSPPSAPPGARACWVNLKFALAGRWRSPTPEQRGPAWIRRASRS